MQDHERAWELCETSHLWSARGTTSKMERWFQPRRCAVGKNCGLVRCVLACPPYTWGCTWSGARWKHRLFARTAEPPNLELSEVDDPDGEAVPHMEDLPEAPRQPTAGRKMVDTETQSARSPAILEWTYSQTTKMRIFVVAAILGNVVSVTLFDVLVLFTEIIDPRTWKVQRRQRAVALNFVAVAFGKDLLFTASYSHHIPLVFAGLLSPRREDVQSTLRHLKRVWEALTKCEREA